MTGSVCFISFTPWLRSASRSVYRSPRRGHGGIAYLGSSEIGYSLRVRRAGRRIALRVVAAVLGRLRVRRVDSVSTQYRLFLLASLLPAVLLVSASAVVQAQNAGSPAGRWSDPATWPDKKVPAKDDVVAIEKDMNVILDVSPPPLRGIKLNGTLSFADNADLELTTEWIMLHG